VRSREDVPSQGEGASRGNRSNPTALKRQKNNAQREKRKRETFSSSSAAIKWEEKSAREDSLGEVMRSLKKKVIPGRIKKGRFNSLKIAGTKRGGRKVGKNPRKRASLDEKKIAKTQEKGLYRERESEGEATTVR